MEEQGRKMVIKERRRQKRSEEKPVAFVETQCFSASSNTAAYFHLCPKEKDL